MRYIIMAGGHYKHWENPRHLSVVNGEVLIARTIRLLKENGIKDIAISSDNPIFEQFGVPVLKHNNLYITSNWKIEEGDWFNAFYPTDEPTCYLFGDVYFSDEAIKTIVETKTDDIEFFGSKPPFNDNYIKDHEEPFALKVVNTKHLKDAIQKTRELDKQGKFWRKPIMWELWTVIKDAPLQTTKGEYPTEYKVINDYTCDIDWKEDIRKLNYLLGGESIMVKVIALREFTYGNFDKITNLVRNCAENNAHGRLYEKDTFECTKEMAKYLTGGCGYNLVKVIEVIPEEVVEEVKEEPKVEEEKPKKTKRTKKK